MSSSWLASALVGTVVLVSAACTELPTEEFEDSLGGGPPEGATSKLTWGRCAEDGLRDIKAQCATLTVPMDYANPGGAKGKLAISRLRHKVPANKYQGVMLTNPGGPGEPGLTVPTLVDGLPQRVSDRYDWIGFDPRGIGASRPAVHCDPDNDLLYRRTYVTTTPAEVDGWHKHALPANPQPGKIGRNEWVEAFLTGLYSPENWDSSAGMWSDWLRNHDPRPIFHILALEPENTMAANLAVTCTDASWPDLDTLVRDTRATYAKARMVTWANTWQSAPCAYWPASAEKPVPVDGGKVRNALLIDQTHDGPTPFAGSLELRRRLPKSSLVAVPGGSAHAESVSGNNPCVGDHVAAYLASGRLPRRMAGNTADATCKAIIPKPG